MATPTTKPDAKPGAKPRTRRPGRKTKESAEQKRVTSERISDDLAKFKKAGGRVEVLGVTQVLTRVGEVESAKAAEASKKPETGKKTTKAAGDGR